MDGTECTRKETETKRNDGRAAAGVELGMTFERRSNRDGGRRGLKASGSTEVRVGRGLGTGWRRPGAFESGVDAAALPPQSKMVMGGRLSNGVSPMSILSRTRRKGVSYLGESD